jgi:hypothetical protein
VPFERTARPDARIEPGVSWEACTTSRGTILDLEAIRKRLAAMDDERLREYGRAAASMAARSQRETWRVQLEEARAEWRRRHPRGQSEREY